MPDPKEIQAKLDAAQEDLGKSIGELKHVIEEKLETPKHVIEVVEVPLSFVKRHAALIGVAASLAFGIWLGRRYAR